MRHGKRVGRNHPRVSATAAGGILDDLTQIGEQSRSNRCDLKRKNAGASPRPLDDKSTGKDLMAEFVETVKRQYAPKIDGRTGGPSPHLSFVHGRHPL